VVGRKGTITAQDYKINGTSLTIAKTGAKAAEINNYKPLAKANGNEAQPHLIIRKVALHCRHIYVTDQMATSGWPKRNNDSARL